MTNVRDRDAGVIIGKLLESAKVMGKPLYLMVTTDGAVSSDKSATPDSNFNSDRGSAECYTFLYNPTGRPATTGFPSGTVHGWSISRHKVYHRRKSRIDFAGRVFKLVKDEQ